MSRLKGLLLNSAKGCYLAFIGFVLRVANGGYCPLLGDVVRRR